MRWIRKIQKKQDKEAANGLVSCYYDEIYIYAYRQLGSKEAAMDMTQEIFIAALGSIGGFDRKRGAFRPWLYRIATNKIIDSRRKKHPVFVGLDDVFPLTDESDFSADVENRELLDKVEDLVSGFDGDTQLIFRLHLYGGHSFPEIAGSMGWQEAAVKSRYYRLMKVLRKELCDEYSNAGTRREKNGRFTNR